MAVINANDDAYLDAENPTVCSGGLNYFQVRASTSYPDRRGIIRVDFTELPSGAVISAATLSAYCYSFAGSTHSPLGRTYWAYEVTGSGYDWVESQVCWNEYATGSGWTTSGGDYTTTSGASCTVPNSGSWFSWTVTDVVQHAQASHGEIATWVIRDGDETAPVGYRYATNILTTECGSAMYYPKLSITYTYTLSGADGIKVSETRVFTATKVRSDGIYVADSLIPSITKVLSEGTKIGDSVYKNVTKVLSDIASVADVCLIGLFVFLDEVVKIGDSVVHTCTKVLSDGANVADSCAKTLTRTFTDGVKVADDFVRSMLFEFYEVVVISETSLYAIMSRARDDAWGMATKVIDLLKWHYFKTQAQQVSDWAKKSLLDATWSKLGKITSQWTKRGKETDSWTKS